ncbi:MAG: hypothetical protein KZQ60_07075 [Candidatus Thiodiazotropha sp. (ex Lucinoma aequizonata)]|nr:hypothetical protein [Candidatus Thiodiazotropha sp. (ex Lucinoma aequizonata)]MCU7887063.1 hypothetical protein [Candidatus Thiodiazotropha sp. (ex Lucinoma aequizonata)]MCU7894260.1 hypothetical protein [Candidatus Thiodiazotropha sp. (ex Lucinoma aequizonata)]MCU7907928.1 hypothetical protein [Candidatus Thiodiazotropha sp. (ex Lucinoma aequizonata)]
MINVPDRRRTVELIEEAVDAGAPAQKAYEELEISLRTYKRELLSNLVFIHLNQATT